MFCDIGLFLTRKSGKNNKKSYKKWYFFEGKNILKTSSSLLWFPPQRLLLDILIQSALVRSACLRRNSSKQPRKSHILQGDLYMDYSKSKIWRKKSWKLLKTWVGVKNLEEKIVKIGKNWVGVKSLEEKNVKIGKNWVGGCIFTDFSKIYHTFHKFFPGPPW